jgi:homoserine kinase
MVNSKAVVRVPASTANLGPGFDSLGMALDLFVTIEMKISDQTEIFLEGPNLEGIPTDKTNLVYEVAQEVFHAVGKSCPELSIRMQSEIPLTRGLGSSAAAIVGALAAANHLAGDPFSKADLFQIATQMEQHPDNVGASMFGGFIVATWDGDRADYLRFEPSSSLGILAVVPRFELPTKTARSVLPDTVTREDAVFNLGHTGLLVAAMISGQFNYFSIAMQDRLHQPHRLELVPGMDSVLNGVCQYGAFGATLSGAGPTLLVYYEKVKETESLTGFLKNTFLKAGVEIDMIPLQPCLEGVALLSDSGLTSRSYIRSSS